MKVLIWQDEDGTWHASPPEPVVLVDQDGGHLVGFDQDLELFADDNGDEYPTAEFVPYTEA